jgi:hypothetical protein
MIADHAPHSRLMAMVVLTEHGNVTVHAVHHAQTATANDCVFA